MPKILFIVDGVSEAVRFNVAGFFIMKCLQMKYLLNLCFPLFAILFLVNGVASADIVTTFSAAEGFTDGPLNGQTGNFSVPVIAQAPIILQNTAGTGEISIPGNGFQRAIFEADQFLVADFAAGDTITLTATDVTITRPAANIPSGVFGLTSGTDPGSAQNEVGLQLRLNTAGDVLLDDQAFGSIAPVDTGFNVGDTFDIQTVITANGDGTFDALSTIGSASFITGDGESLADGTFGVILQSQGPSTEPTTFGGLSIELSIASAVPEPTSFALLAFAGIGLLGRRTRRS